jgi:hypothetical protein
MRGHRDLRLVAAATAICVFGSLITPLGATRIVFAAPLALFLPGYAITAAVFGSRSLGRLDLVPLSVGISLAALILGSILLNYTPGGLRGVPWALLLLLIVLGGCRVAALRREPAPARQPAISIPKVTPTAAILSAGCVAMAAAALILAQTTLHADRAFGYTELWMSPPDQSGRVARIGVTSEQQHPTNYRLEVQFGDLPQPVVSTFTLAPGESRTLSLKRGPSPQMVPVKATLFKRGHPHTVYRRVDGSLPAAGGMPR